MSSASYGRAGRELDAPRPSELARPSRADTVWHAGRFDARTGPEHILFGRMYEDADIERAVFRPGGRIFSIASAGSTALRLCDRHEVVACDINPAQLDYAARRIAGVPAETGTAERVMSFARALMPLAGWTGAAVRTFLSLGDVDVQSRFFRERLDTWRHRAGFDALLSITALRAVYARGYLNFLPRRFGAVLRARMLRCFSRHPNATNPYARALLLGEREDLTVPPGDARRIHLAHADAASYLEACPPASFDGFTLSNILDGAAPAYRVRLARAVERAAVEGATVVLRSFAEPGPSFEPSAENRAADDRAMIWGVVGVSTASAVQGLFGVRAS